MKTNFRLLMLLFFLGACCLLFYLSKEKPAEKQAQAKPLQMPCGTPRPDSISQIGKMVFNANCAACHKMNATCAILPMDKVLDRYKEEGLSLKAFLSGNRDQLLYREIVGDSVICPSFPHLTENDVVAIEKYVEQRTK